MRAITVMRQKLFRVSMVLSTGGAIAAAALSGAQAASAATPSWHPVFSVPGGGVAETVVATGETTGWAFLRNGAAYQRTGATAWKNVAFPGTNGYVDAAAASSPSNVWAAFLSAAGSQVDRWNGRQWSTVKSFPGSVTSLSVLGPNDVWAFGGASNNEGVFHFNGHSWSQAAASSPYVLAPKSLASDGRGGLWMTSNTHMNFVVLLHYSAGQIVNANEHFGSVASIPGTVQALGGNATGVATMPVVYQYS